jgi:hypothetical protein
VSLHLSSLPSLPDASSLPLPTVSDVSDVLVTAFDTAGDAAAVVVESARRRPKVALGVGVAAAVALLAVLLLRRRRHTTPEVVQRDERKARVVAA